MGFFTCLFCLAFIQITSGQVASYPGQIANFAGQRLPYGNTNARGLVPNTQQARSVTNGLPATNQFASAAINGYGLANNVNANYANANANVASANLANTNLFNPNLANANLANANLATSNFGNPNLGNANFAGKNFASNVAGNNFAQANIEAANYAIGYADPKFSNVANYNNANLARTDLTNQLYQTNFANIGQTNIAGPISGNVASSYYAPNAVDPNYGNANFAGLPNSNIAASPGNVPSSTNINFANSQAVTNFANGNIPSMMAPVNLANGMNPTFGIGGNPFQIIGGNEQFGIHIVADTLEVGGTVSVTGKMPIYGTVSLNGNLPTDGTASVDYGCTSQPKL